MRLVRPIPTSNPSECACVHQQQFVIPPPPDAQFTKVAPSVFSQCGAALPGGFGSTQLSIDSPRSVHLKLLSPPSSRVMEDPLHGGKFGTGALAPCGNDIRLVKEAKYFVA